MCYNCGRDHEGHGANYSLFDIPSLNVPIDATVLIAYKSEDRSLLAIILSKIQKVIFWAYLVTGSRTNFISRETIKKLSLKLKRYESRQFVTINGVQKESMPIFEARLNSLNNRTSDQVEITESKMEHFATVRRPTMRELKTKREHAREKQFFMTANEYTSDLG